MNFQNEAKREQISFAINICTLFCGMKFSLYEINKCEMQFVM